MKRIRSSHIHNIPYVLITIITNNPSDFDFLRKKISYAILSPDKKCSFRTEWYQNEVKLLRGHYNKNMREKW